MSFAGSYPDARARFLEACHRHKGQSWSVLNPHASGYHDEPLHIDAVRIGPSDADVLILTLSGTHGGEGYCGSAMQAHLLDEMGALPPGVAVAHVHAVNPFGMSWGIRHNENNVDLNRNWINFDEPLPRDEVFDALTIDIPIGLRPDDAGVDQWLAWEAAAIARHGKWAVDNALSSGQYRMPTAPGFGGLEPQWSRVTLERIVPQLVGSARHVVYLDWHSLIRVGNGNLVFLCFNQTGDALYRRAGSWWGEDRISRKAVNAMWQQGTSAAEKRPSRNGLLMWGVQRLLAPGTDVAGAVVEFCTDRPDGMDMDRQAVEELLCDQYLSLTRDRTSELGHRARAFHMEGCCPADPTFRRTMIEAGSKAYAQALDGAATWAAENAPANAGRLQLSGSFD